MTRTFFLTLTAAVALAHTALAQDAGLSTSLFNNPDGAQTKADFISAPAKMETRFGTLDFDGGGFPTPETAQRIYDEMDLQRATQAFMDFFPHMSLYTIIRSQARDLGFKTASDIGVMADFMNTKQPYLTGNNSTIYAVASIDLKEDGPTVVEIPPGMYGTANDAAFKYLTDFGATGPDKGKGGKYLFLPPRYDGDVPDGYFVLHSNSYRIWAMMRGFGAVGTGKKALNWFGQRLKVYPLDAPDRTGRYINASTVGMNPLPPEDGSFFAMLD
ncbi:MAG: DUF1254 domain-containing protein, partial [Paracoccaceae bacterium]